MSNDNMPFSVSNLVEVAGAHLEAAVSAPTAKAAEQSIDLASAALAQANILLCHCASPIMPAHEAAQRSEATLAWLDEISRLKGSGAAVESVKAWIAETRAYEAGSYRARPLVAVG